MFCASEVWVLLLESLNFIQGGQPIIQIPFRIRVRRLRRTVLGERLLNRLSG